MRQFLEMEADLGSDNEENDNAVKRINKNDAEENEEGLDKDLQGFVVQEQEHGDECEANNKYMLDRLNDDKKQTALVYKSII